MNPRTFLVEPEHTRPSPLSLRDYETRYDAGLSRKEGEELLGQLAEEIDELQELLYAAGTHRLLIILQGMDTSGKDGTIRKVFRETSLIGCRVKAFKAPTEEELAHDFLWRIHQATPRYGEIVCFNRSHYEDVLVVRVHQLVPETVWQQRYHQINEFERLLTENHTLILKFFLHISKEEQKERLLAREEKVRKAWKLNPGDWQERAYWDDYQAAYEDALRQCSTPHAPWHIVPADRKWFRNLAVAHTIVETLRPFKDNWMERLQEIYHRTLDDLKKIDERQATVQKSKHRQE